MNDESQPRTFSHGHGRLTKWEHEFMYWIVFNIKT